MKVAHNFGHHHVELALSHFAALLLNDRICVPTIEFYYVHHYFCVVQI